MKEGYIYIFFFIIKNVNSLIISLYKTNDDVVAQLTPTRNGSTYPDAIHDKHKLSHIAIIYEDCYSQTLC